jgi:FXSXX-COOH protein
MSSNTGDLHSDLVDLTGVDFEQLDTLPDSVFAAALKRLRRDAETSTVQYAGFESFLSPED